MTRNTGRRGTREVLRAIPFLSSLPAAELERLAALTLERSASRGEVLFRAGEPCAGFWIVADGSASIVKRGSKGRVRILETVKKGGLFALVCAVDGLSYTADTEAREDSRFVIFPAGLLRETIVKHPEVGFGVALSLASRLRRFVSREASASATIRSRLAALILESARGASASSVIRLGTKQEELARSLGTVREVVARILRGFREGKLIAQRGDAIRLLDRAALERIAKA